MTPGERRNPTAEERAETIWWKLERCERKDDEIEILAAAIRAAVDAELVDLFALADGSTEIDDRAFKWLDDEIASRRRARGAA